MNLEWVGGRGREPYNLRLEGTDGLRGNTGSERPDLRAAALCRRQPVMGIAKDVSRPEVMLDDDKDDD